MSTSASIPCSDDEYDEWWYIARIQGTLARFAFAAVRSASSQGWKMPWKAGSPVGSMMYESSSTTMCRGPTSTA